MADRKSMEDRRAEDMCCAGNRGSQPGSRLDLSRIRARLDALQAEGDLRGAERLLDYWLGEARLREDPVGEALIENEYVGFFRKSGDGEKALEHGERALALVDACGLGDSVLSGTTRINMATACVAFGQEERAWQLFGEARAIYEARLPETDGRLGGLYNNMGLCATALKKYNEGRELLNLALRVMEKIPGGEGERAVTCLNLADLISAEADDADDEALERAAEETEHLAEEAWRLLNAPELPRDGYYAWICEKCAPVFGHYGYLEYEQKLRKVQGSAE